MKPQHENNNRISFIKAGALFLILVVSLLTVKAENYTSTGGQDFLFHSSDGYFNENTVDDEILGIKGISNPENIPLVADLDNDGVNEIVLFADGNIIVYNDTSLTVADSYNIGGTPLQYSNMILFDVDGDGLREILISDITAKDIFILNYTSGNLLLQKSFVLTNILGDGDVLINCHTANACLVVAMEKDQQGSTSNQITYGTFNSTGYVQGYGAIEPLTSSTGCFPRIKLLPYADIDEDGYMEYVATMWGGGANGFSSIYIIEVFDNATAGNTDIVRIADAYKPSDNDCEAYKSDKYITPALLYDVDYSHAGKEIIVAHQKDADEFFIKTYRYDGSTYVENDRFPEIQDADGVLISNVFLTNVFTDTGRIDFCTLGYDNIDEELDVLCGSHETGDVLPSNTYEFKRTMSDLYPVADNTTYHNVMAVSTDQTRTLNDGVYDLDEVGSLFGVLWFDLYSCGVLTPHTCDMSLIYTIPLSEGIATYVDYNDDGRSDILHTSKTNFRFLSDGFVNTAPSFTEVCFNPSNNDIIKVNTTFEITLTAVDPNDDDIWFYASVYDNSPYELNFTSGNISSGTEKYPITFTMNATSTSAEITLMACDIVSLSCETVNYGAVVQNSGSEYGDSSSCYDLTAEEDDNETEGGTNQEENSIKDAVGIFVSEDSGIGYDVVWLIIMLFLAIGIWTQNEKIGNPAITFGVLITVELITFVLGVLLGFISSGVVVFLGVVGVVILALILRNLLSGSSSS